MDNRFPRSSDTAFHESHPMLVDCAVQIFAHRETVARKFHGRFKHFCETHGAESRENQRPGIHHGGNAGGKVAVAGDEVNPVSATPLNGQRLRTPPLAADGEDLPVLRRIQQYGHFSPDTVIGGFQYTQAECRSGGGIKRVATVLEHPETAGGRQLVTRSHDTGSRSDDRTGGERGHESPPRRPNSFSPCARCKNVRPAENPYCPALNGRVAKAGGYVKRDERF